MKKHTAFFLLFVLGLISLDRSIYSLLSFLDMQRVESGGFNLLYSGRSKFDIVMFGSSRMSLHLNPSIIEEQTGLSSYNFGLPGTNFDQNLFTAEEYLIQNKKPKLLILEAGLQSFDERSLKFLTYLFERFAGKSIHTYRLVRGEHASTLAYYLNHISDGLIASVAYRGQVLDLIAAFLKGPEIETSEHLLVKGALLKKRSFVDPDAPAPSLTIGPVAERRVHSLRRFLDDCRKSDIQVMLVMSPYYRADEMFAKVDYERIVNVFRQLANETGAELLDYTYAPEFLGSADLFYNLIHLNAKGANLLSQLVSNEIRGIQETRKMQGSAR